MKKLLSIFLISGILSSSSMTIVSCQNNIQKHNINLSKKSISNLDFKASSDEYNERSLNFSNKLASQIYYQISNDNYGAKFINSIDFNNKFDLSLKLIDNTNKKMDNLFQNIGLDTNELNDSFKLEAKFNNNSKIVNNNDEYDYIQSSLTINDFIISRNYKINLKDTENDFETSLDHSYLNINSANDDLWNWFFKNFIYYYGLASLGVTKEKLLNDKTFDFKFKYLNYINSSPMWIPLNDTNNQLIFPNGYTADVIIKGNNKYFSNGEYPYQFGIEANNITPKVLKKFKINHNKITLENKNAKGIDLMYGITNLIYDFLGAKKVLPCVNIDLLKSHLLFTIKDSHSKNITDNSPLIFNSVYTINIEVIDDIFFSFTGNIIYGTFFENINIIF